MLTYKQVIFLYNKNFLSIKRKIIKINNYKKKKNNFIDKKKQLESFLKKYYLFFYDFLILNPNNFKIKNFLFFIDTIRLLIFYQNFYINILHKKILISFKKLNKIFVEFKKWKMFKKKIIISNIKKNILKDQREEELFLQNYKNIFNFFN